MYNIFQQIRYFKSKISVQKYMPFIEMNLISDFSAVIKLKSPIPDFTVHIRPICLPDPSHLFNTRQVCYITGWGHTFPYYSK